MSGNVDLSDIGADGDLSGRASAATSGHERLKARGIDLKTVSGDVRLTDVACDRLGAQSTSGDLEYTGTLAKGGLRSQLALGRHPIDDLGPTGFEFSGGSFSGSIRADAEDGSRPDGTATG